MIRIEPLGTSRILPAILVGFELGPVDHSPIDELIDSPPWLLTLDQQAGGMAMSYPSAIGAVLRFEANVANALLDPTPLIHGFKAMAADPKYGVLRRDYPALSQLVGTWGSDYSNADIVRLDRFIGRYFRLPRLTDGIEAFVRSGPVDPLDYFAGWVALTAVVRKDRPVRTIYSGQKSFHVDDSNVDDLILADDIMFDESIAQQLATLAPQLPSHPALKAFLMWENCD